MGSSRFPILAAFVQACPRGTDAIRAGLLEYRPSRALTHHSRSRGLEAAACTQTLRVAAGSVASLGVAGASTCTLACRFSLCNSMDAPNSTRQTPIFASHSHSCMRPSAKCSKTTHPCMHGIQRCLCCTPEQAAYWTPLSAVNASSSVVYLR